MATIYETNAENALNSLEKLVSNAKNELADKSNALVSLLFNVGECGSAFTYAFIKWDGAENKCGPSPLREGQ